MTIIFKKYYSDESLYDLSNDISDVFDSPEYKELPEEDGFKLGTFKVKIEWCEE